MSDYTPVNSDAAAFTATVGVNGTVGVTGGQLVEVGPTDGTVIAAGGGKRPVGVAAHDAAPGNRVTVYLLPGMIHEVLVKSGSPIALGAPVIAATTSGPQLGQADTAALATAAAAGTLIGIALKAAAAGDGSTVRVRFLGV